MIATKNQMAKMLMGKNIMEDIPNTNIQNVTAYNLRDMGQYSIAEWYAGKKYTFFQYKYQNQNRPILVAYDEKGDVVFEQQLSYHIHKLYIDEDGYFYGITTSSSSETNYMLTLFTRIEETNEIHRRKSYLLRNENLTHAPDVVKKDDSNYFITSIEDNVGGYRTMLAWQLTIDIKNGNQWKYWQNEFDHEKDNAEIKYSYDFSVENSIIIRFCFAEVNTISEGSLNRQVIIERANLSLTDEAFSNEGIQKKTKLLLSQRVDSFKFCVSPQDRLPKNFICMTDNNLFATFKIIKPNLNTEPQFQIRYWMQNGGNLIAITQGLLIEVSGGTLLISEISWNLKDNLLSIIVPSETYTSISGRRKKARIYTYMLDFENVNDYYDVDHLEYYEPVFRYCFVFTGDEYIEHDFDLTSSWSWSVFFSLMHIVRIKERFHVTIGILTRNKLTSSSVDNNRATNITYVVDNVSSMQIDNFCNVPEFMQVNNRISLLARMQTQYYEDSTLVSVFNIPNDMENGNINNLKFFDKFDQNICEHDTAIEKNQYENMYINHKLKFLVLNNGVENKEASILASTVLTNKNRGLSSLLPYIKKYVLTYGEEPGYIRNITETDYTIKNNVITFLIDNIFGKPGTIELLGNSPHEVYFKKEFRNELKITITCTIN
jgi:hypothetical protein